MQHPLEDCPGYCSRMVRLEDKRKTALEQHYGTNNALDMKAIMWIFISVLAIVLCVAFIYNTGKHQSKNPGAGLAMEDAIEGVGDILSQTVNAVGQAQSANG